MEPIMPEIQDLLKSKPSFEQLRKQRVKLMAAIREKCGRHVIIFVADPDKQAPPPGAMLHFADIPHFNECLRSIPEGADVDIVLHSGGGLAEVAERVAGLAADRFKTVRYVVPMRAQSAATILALQGDMLVMDDAASLGPIDPQFMQANGRTIPAQSLKEGVDKILKESAGGQLNPGYIPILQQVTPADLQSAIEASLLSSQLVSEGLKRGMLKDDKGKTAKAKNAAEKLCDHGKWLSHGRMVAAKHLHDLGLPVTTFDDDPCGDEYRALSANLLISLQSNALKIYETETTEIVLRMNVGRPAMPPGQGPPPKDAHVDYECPACRAVIPLHLRFAPDVQLVPGRIPFPANGKLLCPHCSAKLDIAGMRQEIEGQVGRKAVDWEPAKEVSSAAAGPQQAVGSRPQAGSQGQLPGNRAARRTKKHKH